ncbi:uncharacterized protein B0I36DRAFT_93944 [Microdochium trichocladiopsis]|uniref:Serine hydrolase domain-containing protein n=1 Tax=Microdochium trichocladiopsis TaxID=1682393 RepID=A0A9P9BWY4_9PEZI|nr:uncharacterized protein B0I36DRAFT_93944 [Microdochium trichocladiopsis]KAH7035551.1 hypothetical protein B0I36DRAFT_93944 [Microdochium trichocladiopsis]
MKFLCLHGAGTSGAIFKAQTAAFRARLPLGRHSFEFIDGPHELSTSKLPGGAGLDSGSGSGSGSDGRLLPISPFFPPPYYTFLRSYTDQEELDAAPEYVLSHILREVKATGIPYDACLCFSQGAAVVAGLLMRHATEVEAARIAAAAAAAAENCSRNDGQCADERHEENNAAATTEAANPNKRCRAVTPPPPPPPFKAVLFICGGPPLPILESLGPPGAAAGIQVSQKAWDITAMTGEDLARKTRLMGEQLRQILARNSPSFSSSSSSPLLPGTAAARDQGKPLPPPGSRPFKSPWDDLSTLSHDAQGIISGNKHQDPRQLPTSFPLNPLQAQPTTAESDEGRHNHHLADVYGLDLRPPLPASAKISIPTAHVYGVKDPRYPAAIQLALFCDPACRRVFDTRAGHEIPRDKAVSDEIADMIAWLEDTVNKNDRANVDG